MTSAVELGVAVTCCSLAFHIWEWLELCVSCRAGEHALHLAIHRHESGPGPVPDPTLRCSTLEDASAHQMFSLPQPSLVSCFNCCWRSFLEVLSVNFTMFSWKYVFLFPVLISSPVPWWCSVLFPSVSHAACHVVTVNAMKEWRKKI